ncbi:MAG TPA: FHA domain-containing protein, partial [Bordetella sp.]|nr:FHA domain-containing protein [Bordetella sp.]
MRLTVLPRRDEPGLPPLSVVFQAPGGTLGRSADNHLALPDNAHGICRVQAALRISDGACYLVNLSGMSHVSVNGRTVTRDQEVPLSPGDELAIGPYTLKAEDPAAPLGNATAAAAAALPAAYAEPDPLLESPLLEGVDLTPPDTHTIHQSPSPEQHPASVPDTTRVPDMDPEPPLAGGTAPAPQVSDSPWEPGTEPPRTGFTPASAAPDAFPNAPAPFDAVPDDLEPPLGAGPQPPQSDPVNVFGDLFGPGTLP